MLTARPGLQPHMKGSEILIIEDNPDSIRILLFLFCHFNCPVHIATSAEEAEYILAQRRNKIKLILLDWFMGQDDGVDILCNIEEGLEFKTTLNKSGTFDHKVPILIYSSAEQSDIYWRQFKYFRYLDMWSKNVPAKQLLNNMKHQLKGFL